MNPYTNWSCKDCGTDILPAYSVWRGHHTYWICKKCYFNPRKVDHLE